MHGNPREALAYIAGLIDGEGSIMITRDASESFMKKRKRPFYSPRVRIGMITRSPLDFMVKVLGFGTVFQEKSYEGKSPMYRVQFRKKAEVIPFLTLIKEFLVLKKEQAELCLEFFRECPGIRGHHPTEETHKKQESYWNIVSYLNRVNKMRPQRLSEETNVNTFEAIVQTDTKV